MKILDRFFIVREVEIVAGRVSQHGRWSGYLGLKCTSKQNEETGTPRPYVLREAHSEILSGCSGPKVRLYGREKRKLITRNSKLIGLQMQNCQRLQRLQ